MPSRRCLGVLASKAVSRLLAGDRVESALRREFGGTIPAGAKIFPTLAQSMNDKRCYRRHREVPKLLRPHRLPLGFQIDHFPACKLNSAFRG